MSLLAKAQKRLSVLHSGILPTGKARGGIIGTIWMLKTGTQTVMLPGGDREELCGSGLGLALYAKTQHADYCFPDRLLVAYKMTFERTPPVWSIMCRRKTKVEVTLSPALPSWYWRFCSDAGNR